CHQNSLILFARQDQQVAKTIYRNHREQPWATQAPITEQRSCDLVNSKNPVRTSSGSSQEIVGMLLLVLLWYLVLVPLLAAQDQAKESAIDWAPVVVDGEVLFRVRGVEAFPATDRAHSITARIEALAADPSFEPSTLRTNDQGEFTEIIGGSLIVM